MATPKAAQELLRAFWPELESEYFFSPKRTIQRLRGLKDTSTLKRFRDSYTSSAYYHAVRDACDAAEVERWSPNLLRHAMATYLKTKYDQETAQYYLGHADISTTSIYARRAVSKLKEIANDIENPFTA